ncbi:hypothetical protein ACHAXT_005256 [Thalassiosira profunda]
MPPKTSGGGSGDAPPTGAILATYAALGAILSFAFGRDPASGILPNDANELAPTVATLCLFLVSYELLDVMGVGIAKSQHGIGTKPFSPSALTDVPEDVYIAQRVQTNQVEQMIPFIVASLSFSLVVNGHVGSVLTLLWVALRRGYARAYKRSAGKPPSKSGIASFTIPCYFILNSLLMGTAIQCIRCLA